MFLRVQLTTKLQEPKSIYSQITLDLNFLHFIDTITIYVIHNIHKYLCSQATIGPLQKETPGSSKRNIYLFNTMVNR